MGVLFYHKIRDLAILQSILLLHVYVVQSVFVRGVVVRPIDAFLVIGEPGKILVFAHDLVVLEETRQTIILVGGTIDLNLAHFFEMCRDTPVFHVAIKASEIVFFRPLDLGEFGRLCRL